MSGIKKVIVSVVLIVTLLAASFGAVRVLRYTAPEVAKSDQPAPAQLVETLELVRQDRVDWIEGYGTARADQTATLAAEVGAAVVELVDGLEAGTPVTEGQVLIRLDDRQYQEQFRAARQQAQAAEAALGQLEVEQANLEKLEEIARASMEVNEAEMRRVKSLFQEYNAAESEYNRVTLAYQQSLQNLQTQENLLALIGPRRTALTATRDARLNEASIAQLNVDRCRIVAPFTGQVDQVMVEAGDSVRIGSPLLRLLTPDRLEIPFQVPVSRRLEVPVGAECTLTVDSMPGVVWKGTVCRLAPSADEQSRTFAAYVEVDNTRQAVSLVPGFFVKAQIKGPLLRDVFVVPRGTVADGQVFLASDGKATGRAVQVKRYLRDLAVVVGDLAAGDHVITTNLDVLYDGAPIRTVDDAIEQPPVTTRTSVAGDPSPPTPVQ